MGGLTGRPAAYVLGGLRGDYQLRSGLPGDIPGLSSGFDLDEERRRRTDAGNPERFGESDLYPDVRPTLNELRERGFWLGLAGNQTVAAGKILRDLALPVDLVATSDDWGVSEPDPGFFRALAGAVPYEASEVLYVGDRLDNDIRPTAHAGMKPALIRRGPWGIIQQHDPSANQVAAIRIRSLAELPDKIADFNAGGR